MDHTKLGIYNIINQVMLLQMFTEEQMMNEMMMRLMMGSK